MGGEGAGVESKVPLLTEFALSRWGSVASFARLGLGEQADTGGGGGGAGFPRFR